MKENNWSNNPNLYGYGCILNAYGIGFEPELFLDETTFDAKLIIFEGKSGFRTFEWIGETRPRTKKIFEYAHLVLKLSKSTANAIQHQEATLFLKQYRDEVLRLSKFSNVEDVMLTFSVANDESFEKHSREFLDLAFDSGIRSIM